MQITPTPTPTPTPTCVSRASRCTRTPPRSAAPARSTAVKSAALEAAGSGTRGSGWAPSELAFPWECRAAQSRQVCPEEAQEPSWGILTMLQRRRLDAIGQRQHVLLVHGRHRAEDHPIEGRRHRSQHDAVCLDLDHSSCCVRRGSGTVLQRCRHTNRDVAGLAVAPEPRQAGFEAGAVRLVVQAHRRDGRRGVSCGHLFGGRPSVLVTCNLRSLGR